MDDHGSRYGTVWPFVSNDDGSVDGAGEWYVVERVEQFGEDVSVDGVSLV